MYRAPCTVPNMGKEGLGQHQLPRLEWVRNGGPRKCPLKCSCVPSGYGNLSPHTMAARLFCIFFALVGIPLNLVVLNHLGHLMRRGVHDCARRLGGAWQVRGPEWGRCGSRAGFRATDGG